MDENLARVALKKDSRDERPAGGSARGAMVCDWLGSGFYERAIAYTQEQNRRQLARIKAVSVGIGTLMLALALLTAGCASTNSQPLTPINGYRTADFTTSHVAGAVTQGRGTGSLWPGDQFRNPISDHRAAFINDLVTVEIVEDSSASGKAETKTGRQSSMGAGVAGLLGFEQTVARSKPNMNLDTLVSAKTNNTFDGSGETTRETKVVATMTCTVVDSYPNGNLLIRGKRMTKVNGEEQIITLSGIVRPHDIAGDNTIESTRIADGRITYYGAGVIADKQNPGWMMRAFDNAWPF